ncbi:MAG: 3-deoxy-D-manno-octulosonic acid transferase [Candidatus Eisenbacteria bacterium]
MILPIAMALYQALASLAVALAIPLLLLFSRESLAERLGGGAAAPGRAAEQAPALGPIAGESASVAARARRAASDGPIWVHAASLGEFEAAAPLLRAWTGRGIPVLVSCTNRTARERIGKRLPRGASVRLAPLDLLPLAARALRREAPTALVFIETEIWPAWILAARRRRIPVAFVSARLSDRAFPRYRRLRILLAPLLRSAAVIGCRTEEDRARWIAIGADASRCHVWGNTKYEAGQPPPAQAERPARQASAAAGGANDGHGSDPFVLVCGSVRPGEEEVLLLAAREPRVRLVVAPRHLRALDRWESEALRRGLATARISRVGLEGDGEDLAQAVREDGLPQVLLVDRMGVLPAFYRAGDAAFVGGTLVPVGGHNLFEPAREGKPVLFGPFTSGVRDVAEALLASGGGAQVAGGADLARHVAPWIENRDGAIQAGRASRSAAENLGGAAERTLAGLASIGIGCAAPEAVAR